MQCPQDDSSIISGLLRMGQTLEWSKVTIKPHHTVPNPFVSFSNPVLVRQLASRLFSAIETF